MHAHLLAQLRTRSAEIHVRWETMLRIEPVSGPLANPDALARLIPETLAHIFKSLSGKARPELSMQGIKGNRLPQCDCGHNPYLAYFLAAERAFVETFVLLQSELPASDRHECDLAELIRTIRQMGRTEIDTFCSICSHRCTDPKCRHRALAATG